MIYDSLKNAERYASISGNFAKAFAFLKETDLASLAAGRHEIDGDRVYASVQEPTYKPWQEGKWEAHRRYADIQAVLTGEEVMGFAMLDTLAEEMPYDEKKDCLILQGEGGQRVRVRAGEMAVFFPQDAHKPNVSPTDGHESGRKIVVKVRLD